MSSVKENLLKIQENIAPYTPKIIAVTKYFDESKLIEAYNAGLRDFGESRVLQAIDKINKLPEEIRKNSTFHMIGHLQTNKVSKAVGFFDYIHSVDSLKLAEAISKTATEKNIVQKIFIQLNNAEEEQKYGLSRGFIEEVFRGIITMKNIEVVGVMNIAPMLVEEGQLKELFEDVVKVRDSLQDKFKYPLKEISMGMSNDYEIAAQCGATMLRIGRRLFS
ncbi:YggS family pyridoxal phosphate-dependent enzyme [bacterium]|nr:YggS family pyridoxal phosphate-dependent enzyme [bacterium]